MTDQHSDTEGSVEAEPIVASGSLDSQPAQDRRRLFRRLLALAGLGITSVLLSQPKTGLLPIVEATPGGTSGTALIIDGLPVNAGTSITELDSDTTAGPVFYAKARERTGPAIGLKGESVSSGGTGVMGVASAFTGFAVGLWAESSSNVGAALFARANDPGGRPIIAIGASGQVNNLQEWQNSSGTVLSAVDAAGKLGVGTATPQTTLQVNGGLGVNIATKTSNYTMTTSDFAILANATSAALTITLPAASNKGMLTHVKKIDGSTHAVTISRANTIPTNTIEGTTTKKLTSKNSSMTFIADGVSTWYLLATAT